MGVTSGLVRHSGQESGLRPLIISLQIQFKFNSGSVMTANLESLHSSRLRQLRQLMLRPTETIGPLVRVLVQISLDQIRSVSAVDRGSGPRLVVRHLGQQIMDSKQ